LLLSTHEGRLFEHTQDFPLPVSDSEGNFPIKVFEGPSDSDGGEIGQVFKWDRLDGREGRQADCLTKIFHGLLPLGENRRTNHHYQPSQHPSPHDCSPFRILTSPPATPPLVPLFKSKSNRYSLFCFSLYPKIIW
jgi:hypothetical protein